MWHPFLDRAQLLAQKLVIEGYVGPRFTTSLHTFYSRNHKIAWSCEIFKSQMTMDLLLLRRCVLSPITAKTCYWIWIYIWLTQRVPYKNLELFTLREHLSSPPDLSVHLLTFYVVLICVFTFRVVMLWCPLRFRMKTMFGSSLPPVICRWSCLT